MGDAKHQRLAKKHDEILDAATRAFRDEGYETTSMDRIAELAGASKRTVYNHFGSKEALFQAVVARFFDEVRKLKEIDWQPDMPLEPQLQRFAAAKSQVAEDPRWAGLIRVVFAVFVHEPELARQALDRAAEGEDGLETWLRKAHAAGALHVPDPKLAANLFWSFASGALFWPQLIHGPMPPQERERMTKEVVETFLHRYRTS